MMALVVPARRVVTVVWRDTKGRQCTVERTVSFVKGFGAFVKWRRRTLFVEPADTVLMVET